MSKRLERKRFERFQYDGFGFPVVLLSVPMVLVRGAWTPDVDYNLLSRRVLERLARSDARLTGNQVRFIRLSLHMTLQQFAARFGVTHPAVIKWERAGNSPTSMSWAGEKDVRLEILQSLLDVKPSEFREAFSALAERPAERAERVRLDAVQPVRC